MGNLHVRTHLAKNIYIKKEIQLLDMNSIFIIMIKEYPNKSFFNVNKQYLLNPPY